ncbi:MAG: hypothetical protein LBC65_00810 [Oscillospiraceae bacterium]|jgi:hypothetical protein|nr:hypothetical protein [Oscillospiraceae bacterium]
MPTTWEEFEMANQTERFEKVTRAEEARSISKLIEKSLFGKDPSKPQFTADEIRAVLELIDKQADEYRKI